MAPGQKVSVELSFAPMRPGLRHLLVDFDSDKLKDVKGTSTVVVQKMSIGVVQQNKPTVIKCH